ncbi:MAG: galactosyldiacylglycerol synthase [Verrucomicrobiota bacterium]|nr:galactosyldiacylglycerol synthase [Verrucomicrobiota bacterium]
MKKILILTAGFGEGHNAAARGVRDGLAQVAAAQADVELRDLFAETYGVVNDWARKGYLELINRAPRAWSTLYNWLDRKESFNGDFKLLYALKNRLSQLLARSRPDAVISVYPAYAHLLDEIFGCQGSGTCKRIVVVTDSITVNAIWYRCSADYFLVPNDATEMILRSGGIAAERIKTFGFPVSPKFAEPGPTSETAEESGHRILYMINVGKATAPELARRLAELPEIKLTVTVGRDEKLRLAMERIRAASNRDFEIIGWTEELPRILQSSHLLISKAGGATVQETIAAGCPMIINQIVPGQEEGNARLIVETGSGVIATSPEKVVIEVQRAFANDAQLWREWSANIRQLSRPSASLEIARFLISL